MICPTWQENLNQGFERKGKDSSEDLGMTGAGVSRAIVSYVIKNGPRAIVAGSDEIAFGILRLLREEAVGVPQQIALASIEPIFSPTTGRSHFPQS
jgi:DNA-binding LacI/PurR family transcriptional regulator